MKVLSPLGRNPYYPKDLDEVKNILEIIEIFLFEISSKQIQIRKETFKKDIFGISLN